MSLSSIQIDAFIEVAKSRNFFRAADALHITQSALSQRILNLEGDLKLTLLIREASGVRLTEVGHEFLRYCQVKSKLEAEFLNQFKENLSSKFAGTLRVGAFSSVMHSVILPALKDLVSKNKSVLVEAVVGEMREIPRLLKNGVVDFVITDREMLQKGVKSHFLGFEENVLVENKNNKTEDNIFLDHDLEDETTESFLRLQKKRPVKVSRMFVSDVHGIIQGVTLGWGRAVLPIHLIRNNTKIKILADFKSLKIPLYLHYYEQPFYPKLHHEVVTELLNNVKLFL